MMWPEVIPEGSVCSDIAAGFDLFSTFAAIAGAEIPTDRPIDGRDLYPLMTNNNDGPPIHRDFSGYEARGLQMSYREGPWKLTIPTHAVYGANTLDEYQLFMLEEDPGETKDVSAEYPFVLEQMIEKAKEKDKSVRGRR